jgi:4-amino-4-deoxy-L-arabinose transferase-like glycosyltransferase
MIRNPSLAFLFSHVWLAILGIILLFAVTHQGIGLGSDSAVYISAGRNLVIGRGLIWVTGGGEMLPMTHFPPFFPMVLSGFELIGLGSINGARLLNSLLFGLNISLVGVIIYLLTKSQWLSIFASFLMLISIFMIRTHSWAMSEPLYLSLALSGLIFLALFVKGKQRVCLILAGIALGLAYLTRYVGISLVLVGLITLFCNFGTNWRRRLVDLIIFMLVSLSPNILWMLRNEILTGYTTSRSLRLNFPTEEEIFTIAKVFLGWFFPAEILNFLPDGLIILGLSSLLLLLGFGIFSWIKNDLSKREDKVLRPFQPFMGSILAFSMIAFSGVIVASYLTIFPPPALDFRIFLPLYVTFIIMIVWGFNIGWNTGHPVFRGGTLFAMVLLTSSYTIRSYSVISELLQDGQGYSSNYWMTSETISSIRNLNSVPLISNHPAAIYLLADKPAYTIPYLIPGRVDEYTYELEEMRDKMKQDGVLLVLFEEDRHPPESFLVEELTRDLSLKAKYSDGDIFAYPAKDR